MLLKNNFLLTKREFSLNKKLIFDLVENENNVKKLIA